MKNTLKLSMLALSFGLMTAVSSCKEDKPTVTTTPDSNAVITTPVDTNAKTTAPVDSNASAKETTKDVSKDSK
ncbi:MAG: hypothetical protein ACJ75J_01385 [Cytophagaceae bacterium]